MAYNKFITKDNKVNLKLRDRTDIATKVNENDVAIVKNYDLKEDHSDSDTGFTYEFIRISYFNKYLEIHMKKNLIDSSVHKYRLKRYVDPAHRICAKPDRRALSRKKSGSKNIPNRNL